MHACTLRHACSAMHAPPCVPHPTPLHRPATARPLHSTAPPRRGHRPATPLYSNSRGRLREVYLLPGRNCFLIKNENGLANKLRGLLPPPNVNRGPATGGATLMPTKLLTATETETQTGCNGPQGHHPRNTLLNGFGDIQSFMNGPGLSPPLPGGRIWTYQLGRENPRDRPTDRPNLPKHFRQPT
jgi:hypothetical protein